MSYSGKCWLEVSAKTNVAVGEAALDAYWVDGEDYCDEEGNVDYAEIGNRFIADGYEYYESDGKIYFVPLDSDIVESFLSEIPTAKVSHDCHVTTESDGTVHFYLTDGSSALWGDYHEAQADDEYGLAYAYVCCQKDITQSRRDSIAWYECAERNRFYSLGTHYTDSDGEARELIQHGLGVDEVINLLGAYIRYCGVSMQEIAGDTASERRIEMKERKFHGIKKAVGEIADCDKSRGIYIEVHYDTADDVVYTNLHWSLGENEWTEYHDPAIIRVGNYSERVTVSKLKEDILSAMLFQDEQ